jgi:hypothetical protein
MLSYFFIYYQEKILKKNPKNGFAMKIRLRGRLFAWLFLRLKQLQQT